MTKVGIHDLARKLKAFFLIGGTQKHSRAEAIFLLVSVCTFFFEDLDII